MLSQFRFPAKLVLTAAAAGLFLAGCQKDMQNEVKAEVPTAQKVITVEGVTEYRLPNGLRVLLFPDAGKSTATVNVTYLVGSRYESYGETGMAHLLEHLMFKGSKNFPDPTKEFTRRGFSMNGSTWLDRTNYHVTFKATDDNLDWALRWSADAMVNSFIAQSDLDTEMTVVRNEFEMGENNPIQVMLKRMQSVLFDWHNYGNSTIGARSDIENVRIENLQAFYRKYYQPDNAVLCVAGKFDADETLKKISAVFGAIPKPERVLEPLWTKEPVADGPRQFEIRRPGTTKVVAVAYRIPEARHPDAQAVSLASDILGDTPRGRLHKALVTPGLATEVFAWPILAYDPGFALFGAVLPQDGDMDRVRDVMIQVIEKDFGKNTPSKDEVSVQATDEKTEQERMFADPDRFGVDITEYIAMGDWKLFFVSRDGWAKQKPEDLSRAASRYFVRDNRVVGYFVPDEAPERASFTQAPDLDEVFSGYTFAEKGLEAEDFDASPENINKRTEIIRIGSLHVALLQKKTRSGDVEVSIKLPYGNLSALTGKAGQAEFLRELLERGTENLSREEIENRFTKLRFQGSLTRFTAAGDTLGETFALLGELFNKTKIADGSFEELRREMVTSVRNRLDDPRQKAADALCRHFNTYPENDPRHNLCSEEKLDVFSKLDPDAVRGYYREIFGTTRAYIAVVGAFDRDAVLESIKKAFSKESAVPYERVDAAFKEIAGEEFLIDTPDKENAVFAAGLRSKKPEALRERVAMQVANWIFGGSQGLSNRLMLRIRQKEGLSYGVGSYLAFGRFDDIARWGATAILAPQNMDKVRTAFFEELDRALKDGFTKQELAEAKQGLIDTRISERAEDAVIAQTWINYLEKGENWSEAKEVDDIISELSLSEVNAAFRKLISKENLAVVLAGDLHKAGKK